MTTPQELKVSERDTTLTPSQLRAAGFIPATLYGPGTQGSQSVQVRAHEFQQFFVQGIRAFKLTGLVNCAAKVQEVQLDPVSHKAISIQLMQTDGTAAPKKAKGGKQSKSAEKATASKAVEAETVLA
jgi:ribosomal protein L25 (general stress protein Ctc)